MFISTGDVKMKKKTKHYMTGIPSGVIYIYIHINTAVYCIFVVLFSPVYGLQDTPASSMWSQLCWPQGVWGHSSRESSFPVHCTPSSRMGPAPGPKWDHDHAFGTPLYSQLHKKTHLFRKSFMSVRRLVNHAQFLGSLRSMDFLIMDKYWKIQCNLINLTILQNLNSRKKSYIEIFTE